MLINWSYKAEITLHKSLRENSMRAYWVPRLELTVTKAQPQNQP